jgi:uncharacterized protein YdiU (UPF0061 family)
MEFNNTYSHLPPEFYSISKPAIFEKPKMLAFNTQLAEALGFEYAKYSDQELAEIFSGQKKLPGSEFISMAYAAHQFGHFVPELGDGRAILIGEVNAKDRRRLDVQLKGAGPTRYSRRGDGFSALGPVLREYLLSEFMFRVNIPTTRALAAVATNQSVYRETILPGGVFTRVASSHIRIGTFQYFAARNDLANLKILLDYAINRHYPEIITEEKSSKDYPFLFLRKVIKAQITLVSSWMSIGFIHGVINTDNMSISGETIDYGPCAFMDYFDYSQVYSYIDKNGRYSFINQINILAWNLARLADTLVIIVQDDFGLDEKKAIVLLEKELSNIKQNFETIHLNNISKKLALDFEQITENEKIDLISEFFETLQAGKLDYTSSFRMLADGLISNEFEGELSSFFIKWKRILLKYNINLKEAAVKMNSHNPIFIPRNHLVEKMIDKAVNSDFSMFGQMIELLKNPYKYDSIYEVYSLPPKPAEVIANTFCGT